MARGSTELFEQAVGNLLRAAGFKLDYAPVSRVPLNYVFEGPRGRRIAIHVHGEARGTDVFKRIADHLDSEDNDIDVFICVSQNPPLGFRASLFERIFGQLPVETVWLGGDELSAYLGLGEKLDMSSPVTLRALQTAAMTTSLERYIGEAPHTDPTTVNISTVLESVTAALSRIPEEYRTLGRQFSFATIRELHRKERSIVDGLRLGDRIGDVTVVLSDLKNFSQLVKAAPPDDLKKAMSQYYARSRELVWDHGATLDKFVGDAVHAIFNYPLEDAEAPRRAIAFARELVALGLEVMGDLTAGVNEVVETGTRVGVCSGDIWVLDIGKDDMEMAFFGDVMNLAARLETNCATDGCLIDNRTHTKLESLDAKLLTALAPKKKALEGAQVKGQRNTIRAWQISAKALAAAEPLAPPALKAG